MDFPDTRDDDNLLMLKVWKRQNPDLANISFLEFSQKFVEKHYSNPESIRRSRQSIQEKEPDLRGKKYYERKGEEQKVAAEINTID